MTLNADWMGANIGKLNGYDNKYVTSELGR